MAHSRVVADPARTQKMLNRTKPLAQQIIITVFFCLDFQSSASVERVFHAKCRFKARPFSNESSYLRFSGSRLNAGNIEMCGAPNSVRRLSVPWKSSVLKSEQWRRGVIWKCVGVQHGRVSEVKNCLSHRVENGTVDGDEYTYISRPVISSVFFRVSICRVFECRFDVYLFSWKIVEWETSTRHRRGRHSPCPDGRYAAINYLTIDYVADAIRRKCYLLLLIYRLHCFTRARALK